MDYRKRFYKVYIIFFILTGCSGLEHSEEEQLRRLNAKGEAIHRSHTERHYALATPSHHVRDPYPWELKVYE